MTDTHRVIVFFIVINRDYSMKRGEERQERERKRVVRIEDCAREGQKGGHIACRDKYPHAYCFAYSSVICSITFARRQLESDGSEL